MTEAGVSAERGHLQRRGTRCSGFPALTTARRSSVMIWDMDAGGDRDASTEDRWDFFVSYTTADQVWAEWVAWQLEAAGYQVLVQAWDMVAGSNWSAAMQDGMQYASRTIAILSQSYLASVYGRQEWQAAAAADP